MIGEDLLIAVVLHYWAKVGFTDAQALPDLCKEPGKKGKRLDAWLLRDTVTIFQVEIKNWSAHSIGGRAIQENASNELLVAETSCRWNEYFGTNGHLPSSAEKVLIKNGIYIPLFNE